MCNELNKTILIHSGSKYSMQCKHFGLSLYFDKKIAHFEETHTKKIKTKKRSTTSIIFALNVFKTVIQIFRYSDFQFNFMA